jgi:hypothetical protein
MQKLTDFDISNIVTIVLRLQAIGERAPERPELLRRLSDFGLDERSARQLVQRSPRRRRLTSRP